MTYDGSGKAAGIKVYLDGKLRGTPSPPTPSRTRSATKVPFKLGQRNTSAKVEDALTRTSGSTPGPSTPEEVDRLVLATRLAYLAAKPADKRPAPRSMPPSPGI